VLRLHCTFIPACMLHTSIRVSTLYSICEYKIFIMNILYDMNKDEVILEKFFALSK
jgi:hypothetical protein